MPTGSSLQSPFDVGASSAFRSAHCEWLAEMLKDRQFANSRLDAASEPLVSATVYLLPDTLQRIKKLCAHKNQRISDLISDAVDDYLANATKTLVG